MRISLNVTNFSWPGEIGANLTEVARAADEAGIDTVWVGDHLLQADPTASPEQEMLEGYTTLGFLASCTSRVRLGTMVTAATYRAPALLVKAVTTLDVLSAGRAWLGIGAGYHEQEAEDFGLDLPVARRERFERLEDTLRLASRMWAGDDSPFAGRHTRAGHPVNNPAPVTRPHPPVLVGGMGEKRTLRLVAELADACNLPDIPDGGATVRRKLEVLAGHCAERGRPYEEIEKTLSTRWVPEESTEDFTARCATYADWGIGHVVLITTGPWTAASVSALRPAVEAVRLRRG
ncbi:TIGR03560 family F420-dependent LLM class oxidoreductase [Actinophytocola xanthii]|uniref:LLM class F420-dependent oxidoreductase n=1 Tax=Actinophytocola xanthii TaxID=1912961 RepID=A0A1Q8CLX0_9PSEU|nr:TIGR03560 family F420-dependent LLM class oxidoreductase [Actinophytocola xanthii]OLF15356.1 LLM class F420-dependent oxidoreductase [Actinophytocola xanthii]